MSEKSALTVPAIGRAAAVLDLVAAASGPVSLAGIVRETGIAKSTAHGLCETLCELKLLLSEAGGFTVGPRAWHWANSWLRHNDLARNFMRVANAHASLRPYTLTLSVLDGTDVIYIGCRNSEQLIGFTFSTGMRLPAVFTATGKAMLAMLPPDQREKHVPATWPVSLTSASCANRDEFNRQITLCKEKGYAIDHHEVREGMVCYGVALCNLNGKVVAGLAVSMTEAEARTKDPAQLSGLLANVADDLSVML